MDVTELKPIAQAAAVQRPPVTRLGTSLSWRGILGTRAVLAGVATVIVAQLAFTYLPPLQVIFHTRPVALADGLVIIAAGAALLLIIEAEKWLAVRFAPQTVIETHEP